MQHTVAILGEAEKGKFNTPYFFQDLTQLVDCLGNPPLDSSGLYFAIQALMFERALIYFRVEQEGFSEADYYTGFKLLEAAKAPTIHALCLPGVGCPKILDASKGIHRVHKSLLITTSSDLHDYLTAAF